MEDGKSIKRKQFLEDIKPENNREQIQVDENHRQNEKTDGNIRLKPENIRLKVVHKYKRLKSSNTITERKKSKNFTA